MTIIARPLWLQDTMTVVGAAVIAEIAGHRPTLTMCPRDGDLTLGGVDDDGVTAAVTAHARRHTRSDSWVQADHTDGRPLFRPMSNGIADANVDQDWWLARQDAVGRLGADASARADHQMIAAIGPWRSPLDCTPRQRGQEIVAGRLRKIVRLVADMNLTTVGDELHGRPAPGTGTIDLRWGRHPISPSRAWCALWALTFWPTANILGQTWPEVPGWRYRRKASPEQRRRSGAEWIATPAPLGTRPLSWWRDIVSSQALTTAAYATTTQSIGSDDPSLRVLGRRGLDPREGDTAFGAWAKLSSQRVMGLLVWPITERKGAQITDRFATSSPIVVPNAQYTDR